MTLFSKDLVRSLALGFALGSAAMVLTLGAGQAQAAPDSKPVPATVAAEANVR